MQQQLKSPNDRQKDKLHDETKEAEHRQMLRVQQYKREALEQFNSQLRRDGGRGGNPISGSMSPLSKQLSESEHKLREAKDQGLLEYEVQLALKKAGGQNGFSVDSSYDGKRMLMRVATKDLQTGRASSKAMSPGVK